MQLMFNQWMNKETMEVAVVKRTATKFREMMALHKHCSARSKGMQHKTMNFHSTIHATEQMLDFGVPENVNTRSDEMHHKRDKKSAKRTSKQAEFFDTQLANKIVHRKAVDLAKNEAKSRKTWKYRTQTYSAPVQESDHSETRHPQLTGARATFSLNDDGSLAMKLHTNMKQPELYKYDDSTLNEIQILLGQLQGTVEVINVFSECRVHGNDNESVLYRASPHHIGKAWEDWAMFDLSKEENANHRKFVPCQMKAFLDLTELPVNNPLELEPCILVVTEETWRNPEPGAQSFSKLLEAWIKKPHQQTTLRANHNYTALVRLNKLMAPAIVIPDLEGPNRDCFRLKPMRMWAQMYEDWLMTPDKREHDEEEMNDESH